MREKISVLIPVFNRETFIESSLKTIRGQSYKHLDIIIYDDGSTDNTVNIVKRIIKSDSRIRLIEGKINKGVAYARNRLIEACKTKFAIWHDSDDLSNVYRVELQYKYMILRGVSLIFCSWAKVHNLKDHKDWQKKPKKIVSPSRGFATLMFPVNKNIKFKEHIILGGEDWDWIQGMKKVYKEITIKDRLYYINFHGDRIGHWKRKFREKLPKELLKTLSYKELIEYYKKNIST